MRIPLIFLVFSLFFSSVAFAGDGHTDDSTHVVTYVVADNDGNHVSGQTVRLTIWRPLDNKFYDFNNNSFSSVGSVTTLHRTLNENATSGLYWTTVTIDNTTLVSGDLVFTVSNDSAIYGDLQSESIFYDRLEQLIKIHR